MPAVKVDCVLLVGCEVSDASFEHPKDRLDVNFVARKTFFRSYCFRNFGVTLRHASYY